LIRVVPTSYIVSLGEGFHPDFYQFLQHNAIQWLPDLDISFQESLYEFAGRLCYESWTLEDGSFVNKNLTKIRSGNREYLKNILKSRHGSVLEHGGIVVLYNNVSRVFTHELVRHRVGVAMSQTSGRYVRADNIKFWIPPSLQSVDQVMMETIAYIEQAVRVMSSALNIDDPKLNFNVKKTLTSALRRITPNGLANNILFSYNGRSLRHVMEMRCSEAAEEEMQFVMRPLLFRLKAHFPSLLQDLDLETFTFENSKV
jgi:thymidylate synthase (FAD)